MSKKKSSLDLNKFNIDFSKNYLIDMLPLGILNRKTQNCKNVSCKIELLEDNYTIRATCEGYQNAYFYVELFDWLLRTKHLKVDQINN